jgi:putative transposase
MAIRHEELQPDLIHHSDRGLQYCSHEYQDLLSAHRIQPSVTEKYDPYENALAERMNGILKTEFLLEGGFPTTRLAQAAVKEAIDTYNYIRPHLSLNMKTPNQIHQSKTAKALGGFSGFEIKSKFVKTVNYFQDGASPLLEEPLLTHCCRYAGHL